MQPDMIASAVHALQLLLEPARLMFLFLGVLIGLAIGVLPGLNGIVGMAMLIPFTYNLDEYTAFALLLGMAAVITSSDFITAVLFGVPGHVGAAATVIDGHAMARKGEAGRAFGAGFASSLAGGIVGAIVLAVSIPVLRPVMLVDRLAGAAGLHAVRHVDGGDAVRPGAAQGPDRRRARPDDRHGRLARAERHAALDLRLALSVGRRAADSGDTRHFRAAGTCRACGVAQAHRRRQCAEHQYARASGRACATWRGNWWLVLRCGVLGTGLGAIPGIGSAVIDWIAYGYAQRTEKNPETFGTGDVRGVIAPESSNNAKEGGHLVPTIAFGVPAGASMAILLGAFLMHGLTPGPDMLTKHLDLTYMIVWSLTLAHVIGAIICLACSGWLAQSRASGRKSCCRSSSRWSSSPPSRASTIGATSIRCCSSA